MLDTPKRRFSWKDFWRKWRTKDKKVWKMKKKKDFFCSSWKKIRRNHALHLFYTFLADHGGFLKRFSCCCCCFVVAAVVVAATVVVAPTVNSVVVNDAVVVTIVTSVIDPVVVAVIDVAAVIFAAAAINSAVLTTSVLIMPCCNNHRCFSWWSSCCCCCWCWKWCCCCFQSCYCWRSCRHCNCCCFCYCPLQSDASIDIVVVVDTIVVGSKGDGFVFYWAGSVKASYPIESEFGILHSSLDFQLLIFLVYIRNPFWTHDIIKHYCRKCWLKQKKTNGKNFNNFFSFH